jgi:hypothetical protein
MDLRNNAGLTDVMRRNLRAIGVAAAKSDHPWTSIRNYKFAGSFPG